MNSRILRIPCRPPASAISAWLSLSKVRVVALIIFCAIVGMLLAKPTPPAWSQIVIASIGIACVAAAAAALNCLLEQHLDANMRRTQQRPLPQQQINTQQALSFIGIAASLGIAILYLWVNMLTMVLTLLTFFAYSIVYTLLLKPATPQNIVIGGASGAMPPLLGWVAINGCIDAHALLLFAIIFAWTPPHFWALAMYRRHDYSQIPLPMLPITHGIAFTGLQILLYTLILSAITLLPVATAMSGRIYLICAAILNLIFISYAYKLWRHYSDAYARATFRYSVIYLTLLFSGLLIDHYVFLSLT